jgi:Flp pilus assembly protein TadG
LSISHPKVFASRAGNMAMTFALLTPLLALIAGGAIDVTNASMRQSQLQQAADAAAVGAVARNSPGYLAALQMSSDGGVPDSTTKANTQAIFSANWKGPADSTAASITGNSSPCNAGTIVCKSGTTVYSAVSVTGAFKSTFLGLLDWFGLKGMSTVNLSATSHAADNIPAYMNFYVLLDNTPSMGVGATPADISALVTATANSPDVGDRNCAFACHDTQPGALDNYYALVKSPSNPTAKITTRISSVAQAAANLFSTLQSTEASNGIANEFSAGVYDFGAAATDPTASGYTGFNQVYPAQSGALSSNLQGASTAAAGIDLMTVSGQGQYNDEDTSLEAPLAYAANYVPASGSGTSPTTAKQVLFFVTDGMDDTYNCARSDSASCRYIQPMNSSSYFANPNACDKLKAKGVEIAILYTTQYPIPSNSFYTTYVAPYNSGSPTAIYNNLNKCATYFRAVDPGGDINQALQGLLSQVLASVRITG